MYVPKGWRSWQFPPNTRNSETQSLKDNFPTKPGFYFNKDYLIDSKQKGNSYRCKIAEGTENKRHSEKTRN